MKMQISAIFVKESLKTNILKIKIIVMIQVNKEVLHIVYVIQSKLYQKEFLRFFTMDVTMNIILL